MSEISSANSSLIGVGGEPLRDLVQQTLHERLTPINEILNRVADQGELDGLASDELRKSTDEAIAALKFYDQWLPLRRSMWIKKQLKRLRGANQTVSHRDVLQDWLKQSQSRFVTPVMIASIEQEREAALAANTVAYERIVRDQRFSRRCDKLVKKVSLLEGDRLKSAAGRFGGFVIERIQRRCEQLFAILSAGSTTSASDSGMAENLCEAHLECARLSALLELLSGLIASEAINRLRSMADLLQERLREFTDLVLVQTQLRSRVDQ